MRILHVITSLAPHAGGPTVVLKALTRAQAKLGHEIVICTTNADTPRGELAVPPNRPMIKDQVTIWHFALRYFRTLCVSDSLTRWINTYITQFDIVHIHGLYRFPPTYAAWRARKTNTPYLICPHGSLDPFLYKQSRYSLVLKRIYECLFDRPNLNHAAAIHYTAREEAERAAILGLRSKSIIIPNGIDWQDYRNLPVKGNFRHRLDLSDATPLVLFLGRINFKKGLDLLIPAFSSVLQKHPQARLAIVGPDNEGFTCKVKNGAVNT